MAITTMSQQFNDPNLLFFSHFIVSTLDRPAIHRILTVANKNDLIRGDFCCLDNFPVPLSPFNSLELLAAMASHKYCYVTLLK